MLFNEYDSIYIPKDNREIRTGNFCYRPMLGKYLTNVTVEETDTEIKIHGFHRKFKYHCNDDFPATIFEKDYHEYCIKEENFEFDEPFKISKFFGAKPIKYLKDGFYMLKKMR